MELLLFVRKDEHRPNDVRVVFDKDWYKVQWHHEPSDSWMDKAIYDQRNAAITDVINWHSMPIPAMPTSVLEKLVLRFLHHLPDAGYVNWLVYDDSGSECQIEQRMTYEAFMKVRNLLSEDKRFDPKDSGETYCSFDIPSCDLYCKGRFISDLDYFKCRPSTVDDAESLVAEIKSDIQDHFQEEDLDKEEAATDNIMAVELILCYSANYWSSELFVKIENDLQIDKVAELFRAYVDKNPDLATSETMGQLVHVGFYGILEGIEKELPTIDYAIQEIDGELQIVKN